MVCAYVFRGRITHTRDPSADPIAPEFRASAQTAVQCALSVIDLTIGDSDLTVALAGLPHYFHSMIAYACAFLIKTVMFHLEDVDMDVESTREKISKVIQLCNSTECGQHHVVRWIGNGLQTLLVRAFEVTREGGASVGLRGAWQPGTTGGASALHSNSDSQPQSLHDPTLAEGPTTYMSSSESMQGLSEICYNQFGLMNEQIDTFPYSSEDIDDGFFISARAQAHINHCGLGLGLLK